jgi:hypothetical protein
MKIMTNHFFALCYICNFDFVFLQSESGCYQGPRQQLIFFYETLLKKISGFRCTVAFYFSDIRLLHDAVNDVKVELYGFLFFMAWSIGTEYSINNVSPLSVKFQPIVRFFLSTARQPLLGQGVLIIQASRSDSNTLHSVGLLWTSDQPDADVCRTTKHSQQTSMSPGWIRTHSPSERAAATHVLDRAVTGIVDYKIHELDFECVIQLF